MIRVLLADDRVLERTALARSIATDNRLAIVGESAVRGLAASVHAHAPDAIALVFDGTGDSAAACREIEAVMAANPCPILALHRSGGEDAGACALRAGAVAALPAAEDAAVIRRRLRILSGVPVVRRRVPQAFERPRAGDGSSRIVALVASTGGPPALARVLKDLGAVNAPVLLVQHIDAGFVAEFTGWLGQATGIPCVIARAGQLAAAGTVYVAPPNTHLRLGPGSTLQLSPDPTALHRPSGDVLLQSVARQAGSRAVAAVLTGMGEDGARGLLDIHQAGGQTFAQDEATSAVYGMPRAAARLAAAGRILPLSAIGAALADAVRPQVTA